MKSLITVWKLDQEDCSKKLCPERLKINNLGTPLKQKKALQEMAEKKAKIKHQVEYYMKCEKILYFLNLQLPFYKLTTLKRKTNTILKTKCLTISSKIISTTGAETKKDSLKVYATNNLYEYV